MKLDEDELENLRDGDLFKLMANDVKKSEIAWIIFNNRYIDDFHKLVHRINPNPTVVEDLVSMTMEEAYFRANTFKGVNSLSIKSERGRTLSWLGKIAKNIYNQTFRISKKEIKIVPQIDGFENETLIEKSTKNGIIKRGDLSRKIRETEDDVLGTNHLDNTNLPFLENEIFQEVLSEISERDRDVLLATFDEYDPEIKNQKLSREKIKELCERHNITPDNIRQIRLRTFKKVRDKCLQMKAKKVESKL